MSEKVYPGIYRDTGGSLFFDFNQEKYYNLLNKKWKNTIPEDDHTGDTNITREYLNGTKIKIESEEHQQSIRRLCLANGIKGGIRWSGATWAVIEDDTLHFITPGEKVGRNLKQIYLPLPPKETEKTVTIPELDDMSMKDEGGMAEYCDNASQAAIRTLTNDGYTYHGGELWKPPLRDLRPFVKFLQDGVVTSVARPPLSSIMKIQNNSSGAYVHYDSESNSYSIESKPVENISSPQSKEWPQVGDEAIVDWGVYSPVYGHELQNEKVVITSLFLDEEMMMATVKFRTVNYCVAFDALKKPLTQEEGLAEVLISCTNNPISLEAARDIAATLIHDDVPHLTYTKES